MASFKDRKGSVWSVELDAPTIEEIRADHGLNLASLETDPLLRLRNEPLVLIACASVICRDEMKERSLTEMEFMKLLPRPPDDVLNAIRDAVIGFFPSGRASHVREVLAKFDQMATKTDEIAESKIAQLMTDPKVMAAIDQKADQVIDQAVAAMMTGPSAGT